MHFAKSAASNALKNGRKSVELCQAYILMSIYAEPARHWEDDRSWLFVGLAIRWVDFSKCSIERSCLTWSPHQNCDRPESTSPVPEETDIRTRGTGDVEPYPDMDDLLQLGQVNRNTVWQAVDHQRRLVRSF